MEKINTEQENAVLFASDSKQLVKKEQFERVAPQWIIYNKLCEFLDDPEIFISRPTEIMNENEEKGTGYHEIIISSNNFHKITAIAKAFKSGVDNVVFKFEYTDVDNDYVRTLEDLFRGNRHFDNVRIAYDAMGGTPVIITTFKDETIQYKADNRFVPGGYSTTLEENLIKDFFKEEYRRSVYVTKEKTAGGYDWF